MAWGDLVTGFDASLSVARRVDTLVGMQGKEAVRPDHGQNRVTLFVPLGAI